MQCFHVIKAGHSLTETTFEERYLSGRGVSRDTTPLLSNVASLSLSQGLERDGTSAAGGLTPPVVLLAALVGQRWGIHPSLPSPVILPRIRCAHRYARRERCPRRDGSAAHTLPQTTGGAILRAPTLPLLLLRPHSCPWFPLFSPVSPLIKQPVAADWLHSALSSRCPSSA